MKPNRFKLPFRKRSGSMMMPLFGSYIAVLLLAIVIGSILYWKAKTVVEHTVDNTNAAMLEQLREVADGRLKEIEQLEQQIAFHPRLGWLFNHEGSYSDQDAYSIIEFTNDLQRFKNLSKLIYDFYIYDINNHLIIGPNVKSTPEIVFDHVYRFAGKTSADWETELKKPAFRLYEPAASVRMDNGSTKPFIVYRQSLPFGDSASVKGFLIVMIDEGQFRSLFDKLASVNRGEIYILDQQNRVISSTAGTRSGISLAYRNMANAYGKLEEIMDGQSQIVTYTTSAVNGWKYVYVVPRAVFLDHVYAVKRWAVLLLSLCAFGGGAASLYLAYRNYKPVRDVVRIIRKWSGSEQETGLGEFELIRSTIESARLTESQLRGMLAQQAPILRVNFLTRLIRGYVQPAELEPESLDFVGISFISSSFAVILIDAGDISGFAQGGGEREWPFVGFILSNIAGELAGEHHLGFPVELERGRVAVLINLRTERLSMAKAEMQEIAEKLTALLESRFRIKLSVGISGVTKDPEGIGEAFRDALKELDERIVLARRTETDRNTEASSEESYFYYPLEVEQQLVNLVKAGEADKADKLLDALYDDNFTMRSISPELGRYLLVTTTATLLRIVQSYPDLKSTMAERVASIEQAGDSESMQAAFTELKQSYRTICLNLKERRSDTNELLQNGINQYIEANFGENMLSVNSIADHFNLTPQYISAVYKKSSGQNLTDYVAEVRIREAKKLLTHPSMTIAQVAAKVGYANDIGFIRFFKKYEGITPGAYRLSLQTDK